MKDTILDLGCGTGETLKPYAKKYPVVGIDLDAENIRLCQKQMPTGKFIVGDITQVDLSQFSKLKKIICTEVIEHVPDWKKVIENLSKAQSGTKLYLTVPHETSEKKLLNLKKDYWAEIGHLHFFDGEEIKEKLQNTGWGKIKINRVNAALYFELKSLFRYNAPCVRHTYYENILPLPTKLFYQLFRPNLFQTKLKFIPLWIITLPLSLILNKFWGATIRITAYKK